MMALPMNSLYSLTWGDYGTSLVSAIQLLRCHGDLVDCTLAAGGRSFPAHKIVLCAASPFLLDLLKNTPCKHPVVMLAGVNANDLEALLEFVYRGEVSVDHAQLPSLLQAAQCLNIQGLAPQTVTKDDYTHSIQLQHMIPQHHHEQDQLIATIATAPQQTVHAQVVDDIHQAGQILQTTTQTNAATGQQQTILTTDATKDVIQQYLPARKRKPRVKKMSPTAPKISKVEGMETIISTPTSSHTATTVQTNQQQQQQVQQQQQQQVQQQQVQQQQQIENGTETQIITSTPIIKSEVTKVETIVSIDPNSSGDVTMVTPSKPGKRTKNTSGEKPRSRSQSEQPATCPICYAVIRQSRNLRRHLELRHFAKPGVKKEKKTPGKKTAMAVPPGTTNASGTSTVTTTATTVPQVQSVQSLHTLQTVQVKKDPDAQNQQQQQQQQQPQTMTVTTTNNGQQQQHQQQQQQQPQPQPPPRSRYHCPGHHPAAEEEEHLHCRAVAYDTDLDHFIRDERERLLMQDKFLDEDERYLSSGAPRRTAYSRYPRPARSKSLLEVQPPSRYDEDSCSDTTEMDLQDFNIDLEKYWEELEKPPSPIDLDMQRRNMHSNLKVKNVNVGCYNNGRPIDLHDREQERMMIKKSLLEGMPSPPQVDHHPSHASSLPTDANNAASSSFHFFEHAGSPLHRSFNYGHKVYPAAETLPSYQYNNFYPEHHNVQTQQPTSSGHHPAAGGHSALNLINNIFSIYKPNKYAAQNSAHYNNNDTKPEPCKKMNVPSTRRPLGASHSEYMHSMKRPLIVSTEQPHFKIIPEKTGLKISPFYNYDEFEDKPQQQTRLKLTSTARPLMLPH